MDSVESELLKNLENLFGFQYKGKKFQDLNTQDFLDVYKIFFRIYDTAWLLSEGKPKNAILKQITSFLQRMELGHLILKGEDLLDCKKNCRLLGAIVSKLESRHNGTKNIQAAVRKIRLLKPKTGSEKNLQKQTSSESSGEEEPIKLELVIPHKGKELPRTPPSRPGSDGAVNKAEFLKPSPLAAHLNQLAKPTRIVSTQKGFRPILPTKEIPRTPLKGVVATTPIDSCFNGHNLTVDFSSERLTSSNTSTPYDHRTSRNQTLSGEGDATFVVSTKRGVMENPEKKELSEAEEAVSEDADVMAGTYVKESKPKKSPGASDDNTFTLEMETSKEIEKVLPTEILPPLHSTFALPMKNAGKAAKNNKEKDSSGTKSGKTTTVKKATEVTPENLEINGDATDTVVAKGKKGRGKKAGKKDTVEENHVDAVMVGNMVEQEIPVAEAESEESAPVAESKGKKGRGKKAVVEEVVVNTEPKVPEGEKQLKKGRSKRPSKKETNEEKQEEIAVEKNHPAEVETTAPVAEAKEKKGRGKKAQAVKAEVINSLPEGIAEPIVESNDAQENPVKVAAGPKPKSGPKPKIGPKSKMETKPTEEDGSSPIVEPEVVEKKGRGKKGNQSSDSVPQAVPEMNTSEVQAPPVVEATEVSPAPEVKKGRGKTKATVEVQEQKEPESHVPAETDTKDKRGRGRQAASKEGTEKAVKTNDESLPEDINESPLPAAPVPETKEKRGRGRQAKAQTEAPVEETTEALEVVPAKRGRGRKATPKVDSEEEAVEEVKETKAKGKKGVAAAKKQIEEDEKPVVPAAKKQVEEEEKPVVPEEPSPPVEEIQETLETPEAVPAKRGRGKKAATPTAAATKVAEDLVDETKAVEEVKESKAKGKKGPATKKQSEEKAVIPEAAEKVQKTTKRGKVAGTAPEESDVSSPKKIKEGTLELEGVRKSSRNQGEPAKTYDESSENGEQTASKKRGGRKKAANVVDAITEEAEENKKTTKKKAASESPEAKAEPLKVGKAAKRGNKRVLADDPAEEKTKKGDKSPDLPLRVVNGLEGDAEVSPSKRNKASDESEAAAEEPEKKTGRGRKKKAEPQVVESENKSPDDGKKKAKRGGKEATAAVEVEKKKPVGRKKAAAAVQEEEPETEVSPVLTKQRGKRAAAQDADSDVFVTIISGQQSTDPSPAVPPMAKGRRLKLTEEKQQLAAEQAESDEEISVPVAAKKRTYTRRNK